MIAADLAQPAGITGAAGPATILLLDDDEAVRASLQFALELHGYKVETFASAEALTAFAGPDEPACLILDYRLPGIDGLSLLDALRRLGVTAPAILITTHPGREVRRRAAAMGTMLIEKPLLGDELTAAIAGLVPASAGES
ncbi:response regulator transcription factor [Sphingosinicella sp. LY1275]|uniref:response regulator transcription factor n=1 Tax=Sphingosinicella sp. LY1275 TaxID=3095379 RepID=UPI002ADEED7B|nr:response regulator [Sphingosinicella sp. LY1275]MEA1015315.1 response regulator [Sphingosinicella sp. LY1275]